MHVTLGRLEGRDLITRTAHPEQPGGVLDQLTDVGVVAVEQIFPILERKLVDAYAGHCSESELETIATLMERL